MRKLFKVLFFLAVLVSVCILSAGIYKFNYLSGQKGYDVDGNKIVVDSLTSNNYFDPSNNKWKNDKGVCKNCTLENGYTSDGQILGAPSTVFWHEIFYELKNDLDENPPIEEVHDLFSSQYSADQQWFGTHVSLTQDVFHIIVATEQSEPHFTDPRGALLATYEVTSVNEVNR